MVKTLILQQVFLFLWSLLLIIPASSRPISNSMVPYILAENPTLPWRRALEMTRRMTDGSKFDIFVLQLSFIGWFLSGRAGAGLRGSVRRAYYEATMAGLYARLRAKALKRGFASGEEHPGIA